MSFKKNQFYTLVQQACDTVPEFKLHYHQFLEKATLAQNSHSLICNYSRCIAQAALAFNRVPHYISVSELNTYLYHLCIQNKKSEGYFKQAVHGLRYWFKMFNMPERSLCLPLIKRSQSLPKVLSKQECKELFKAPRTLKHRFLLAFAYSAGLRINELRLIQIADVDTHRKQIHVRHGKGKKDRYVMLSSFIASKLPLYLNYAKPKTYLFEGRTPGEPMGRRSIQSIVKIALTKTNIKKDVSMHTLRHSFATHLLEDGIDICSIQKLLGHAFMQTTIIYLHIAQLKPQQVHSPLDSLYNLL